MKDNNLVFVKAATTPKEMDAVYRLTHDTFVERGIIKPQPSGRLSDYPGWDSSERTVVFVAYLKGKILGTISLTTCWSREEVFNYKAFRESIDETYRSDEKTAAGWRLAVDTSDKLIQSIIVLKLVEAIHEYLFSTRIDVTYFSFVVEHLAFYQKMFIGGKLIDRKEIKTDVVDTELYFMRYRSNFSVLINLRKRIRSMETKIVKRRERIYAA
jgi:hypothetical protein